MCLNKAPLNTVSTPLGIILDENLNLDYHINNLCKKLSRLLYCIKMAKNNLNTSGLWSLYFALIHSHLSCFPIILNCLTKSNAKKLTKSAHNVNTQPLFFYNKILPLDKIVKQAKLLFMHSVFHE